MNKDTIIKVLLAIIALMVFAWLWRIIIMVCSSVRWCLRPPLLSVLIALSFKLWFIAVIVFAVKLFTVRE